MQYTKTAKAKYVTSLEQGTDYSHKGVKQNISEIHFKIPNMSPIVIIDDNLSVA